MEEVNLEVLEEGLKDLFLTIQRAKNLVTDGKEVHCNQRLQGALTKCGKLLQNVNNVRNPDGNVAKETIQEKPASS